MNLVEFNSGNYLTLRRGEKQGVQYARVLTQVWEKPTDGYRYLFLDEPLDSLDISYQHEFLRVAVELVKEHTVLVAVIYDIILAAHSAGNLFFFEEGELVRQGRPGDILTENVIERIFSVKNTVIENPVTGKSLVVYS